MPTLGRVSRASLPSGCSRRSSRRRCTRSRARRSWSRRYNLLYRWFLDLPLGEDAWTQEAFSINRFELHDLCRKFFDRVVAEGIELVSAGHFTVDGTLIRSMASQKSLAPLDDDDDAPGGRDELVGGQKRTNATHRSRTEARLARKDVKAHLCHSGHVLMENRSGLCLAIDTADGRAERRAADAASREEAAQADAADAGSGCGVPGGRVPGRGARDSGARADGRSRDQR